MDNRNHMGKNKEGVIFPVAPNLSEMSDNYLILNICVSLRNAGRILNLCNRLWHKFLGERIVCYWISWTARRAVFGMHTKPSKMAGAVQYWNYRFRVV